MICTKEDWDSLREAMQPVTEAWEEYVETGQSITIGPGETTICIKARHIQQLVSIWNHINTNTNVTKSIPACPK